MCEGRAQAGGKDTPEEYLEGAERVAAHGSKAHAASIAQQLQEDALLRCCI